MLVVSQAEMTKNGWIPGVETYEGDVKKNSLKRNTFYSCEFVPQIGSPSVIVEHK